MGHQTKGAVSLKTSIYWTDAMAKINKARSAKVRRMIDDATRKLVNAQLTLGSAEQTLTAAKIKFGKRSDHMDFQRAGSAKKRALRQCKYSHGVLEGVRGLPAVIDDDRDRLYTAVSTFLDGKKPDPQCGSMRLSVTPDGNLRIFFNVDCSEIREKRSDSSLVIKPDGYTHSMFLG